MERKTSKKRIKAKITDAATPPSGTTEMNVAEPEPPAAAEASATPEAPPQAERPAWVDGAPVNTEGQFIHEGSPPPTAQMGPANPADGGDLHSAEPQEVGQHGKHWGPPYKSIFTCREMGFELGENRRFKQRVFTFRLKPTDDILAALKENGFTYRADEKSWTIPANAHTRKLTDELARE